MAITVSGVLKTVGTVASALNFVEESKLRRDFKRREAENNIKTYNTAKEFTEGLKGAKGEVVESLNAVKGLINGAKTIQYNMNNMVNTIKTPIQAETHSLKYQLIKNSPSHNAQPFGQYASNFDYFGTYNDYIASQSAHRGITQDNTSYAQHLADMYQKSSASHIKTMMNVQDNRSNTSTSYMDRFR